MRTLNDKHWCSGWYSYDSENTTGGEAPSTQEMYIENAKLKLNLADCNNMKIRIPTSEEGIYRIDFAIKKTGGSGQYVRMDVNSTPSTSPSDANPSGAGAMTVDFAKNSEATYSKTVSLAPNDNVNFLGLAVVEKAISLEIDDMTVTKIEQIENVHSIKAVPADGLTNVSTYA